MFIVNRRRLRKWIAGNDFPLQIDWHAQVRYEDTFLITGGWGGTDPSDSRELDTIYRFVINATGSFFLSFVLVPFT